MRDGTVHEQVSICIPVDEERDEDADEDEGENEREDDPAKWEEVDRIQVAHEPDEGPCVDSDAHTWEDNDDAYGSEMGGVCCSWSCDRCGATWSLDTGAHDTKGRCVDRWTYCVAVEEQ